MTIIADFLLNLRCGEVSEDRRMPSTSSNEDRGAGVVKNKDSGILYG